ncbi:MAG: hypothetical protein SF066_03780, partial [Thermoanaerobaculia bacterium]|nr:hypothetical protein [Thermoanaerobaculia bacterium]
IAREHHAEGDRAYDHGHRNELSIPSAHGSSLPLPSETVGSSFLSRLARRLPRWNCLKSSDLLQPTAA